jgi:hypothetical protein
MVMAVRERPYLLMTGERRHLPGRNHLLGTILDKRLDDLKAANCLEIGARLGIEIFVSTAGGHTELPLLAYVCAVDSSPDE